MKMNPPKKQVSQFLHPMLRLSGPQASRNILGRSFSTHFTYKRTFSSYLRDTAPFPGHQVPDTGYWLTRGDGPDRTSSHSLSDASCPLPTDPQDPNLTEATREPLGRWEPAPGTVILLSPLQENYQLVFCLSLNQDSTEKLP
jgi:hypothetical protein